MNGYVKIVIGIVVVAAPVLFLASCMSNPDIPSASDNSLPSATKGPDDAPKGPESGEADFAQHY